MSMANRIPILALVLIGASAAAHAFVGARRIGEAHFGSGSSRQESDRAAYAGNVFVRFTVA